MNRGIHALVINAYDMHNGKSLEMYNTFKKMLVSLLGLQSLLIEKSATDLADYVFDWEFELLGEGTKTIAKRFDKVDMVFLAGAENYCYGRGYYNNRRRRIFLLWSSKLSFCKKGGYK